MTKRYFNGVVPDPGPLGEVDESLLQAIDGGFSSVASYFDACTFRSALQECLRLSTLVNQYLEETSPWATAKTDLTATGRSLYVALQAISGLNILWAPILPFTCQQLYEMLGEEGSLFGEQIVETYQETSRSHIALTYNGESAVGVWARKQVPSGRQLPKPKPLFKRLDASIADEELARLNS